MAPDPLNPRRIPQTGDDRPARSVWGYARRMTGWPQVAAFALALAGTLLALAPIELQRRMIDDAIGGGDLTLLMALAGVYLASIVVHQGVKLALRTLQAWMGESAIRYTRRHLWRLHRDDDVDARSEKGAVAILTRETEALGRFVGGAPSDAFANIAMLVGALGYMIWVSPWIAAAGLVLLAPQAVLTPYLQKRLNRLVAARLRLVRRMTDEIGAEQAPADERFASMTLRVFRIRIAFDIWKYALKAALNLMNAAAPLAVIAVGGWLVIEEQATVGVVVAFVTGFSRLGDPIRQLIAFYREAAEAEVRHDMIAQWMTPAEGGKGT